MTGMNTIATAKKKGVGRMLERITESSVNTSPQHHLEPYRFAVTGSILQTTGATSFIIARSVNAPTQSLLTSQRLIMSSAILTYIAGVICVVCAIRRGRVAWKMMVCEMIFFANTGIYLSNWILGSHDQWRTLECIMVGLVLGLAHGIFVEKLFSQEEDEE